MDASWCSSVPLSPREEQILKLCKKRPIFGFLRKHRHLIFDPEMVASIHEMYAGEGRPPKEPVRLAMAMVLQVAFDEADSEIPALTAADLRWRMVLGLLDESETPAFSQGTVFNFRERALAHGFAQRLLDRTVDVARETKGFGHRNLRAVIDSSPLLGAGRVEDSINLIGRALRRLIEVAALATARPTAELGEELALAVVTSPSVKGSLDIDWRDPDARRGALNTLVEQFHRLEDWLESNVSADSLSRPPLSDSRALVERLLAQDTEPDPSGPPGSRRISRNEETRGPRDRQISLSDPDMRHGRKSKTKLFSGYKRHVVVDADVPGLVTAVHVLPANVQEHEAVRPLLDGLEASGWVVSEVQSDRGYLPAEALHVRRRAGLRVISKPPSPPPRGDRLSKADFAIDFQREEVTCPNGRTTKMTSKGNAIFGRSMCTDCGLARRCLPNRGGRKIALHPNEAFFREMSAELATPSGRARRRERVVVEHALAHVGAIQGHRARFRGLSKNQFDLERTAAVTNLYVIARLIERA